MSRLQEYDSQQSEDKSITSSLSHMTFSKICTCMWSLNATAVCVCVSQLDEEIMLDGLVSIIQSDAKW